MKQHFLLVAIFAASLLTSPPAVSAQTPVSQKKGVGLAERHGLGAAQLNALEVAWFYNWHSETAVKTGAKFVPMIFSAKKVGSHVVGDTVLGYNEPDNEKQSNIPVQEAVAHWPGIAAKAKVVGGPAMAGNPLKSEWLHDFMKSNPKVDFITVHWYKGADSKHFIRDMQEIHAKFNKPVWITEFAPQTAGSSEKEPQKFTDRQVTQFINETIRWMEGTPWVEAYAWHDSKTGTSALFDASGELTATGKAYAAAKHTSK